MKSGISRKTRTERKLFEDLKRTRVALQGSLIQDKHLDTIQESLNVWARDRATVYEKLALDVERLNIRDIHWDADGIQENLTNFCDDVALPSEAYEVLTMYRDAAPLNNLVAMEVTKLARAVCQAILVDEEVFQTPEFRLTVTSAGDAIDAARKAKKANQLSADSLA